MMSDAEYNDKYSEERRCVRCERRWASEEHVGGLKFLACRKCYSGFNIYAAKEEAANGRCWYMLQAAVKGGLPMEAAEHYGTFARSNQALQAKALEYFGDGIHGSQRVMLPGCTQADIQSAIRVDADHLLGLVRTGKLAPQDAIAFYQECRKLGIALKGEHREALWWSDPRRPLPEVEPQ